MRANHELATVLALLLVGIIGYAPIQSVSAGFFESMGNTISDLINGLADPFPGPAEKKDDPTNYEGQYFPPSVNSFLTFGAPFIGSSDTEAQPPRIHTTKMTTTTTTTTTTTEKPKKDFTPSGSSDKDLGSWGLGGFIQESKSKPIAGTGTSGSAGVRFGSNPQTGDLADMMSIDSRGSTIANVARIENEVSSFSGKSIEEVRKMTSDEKLKIMQDSVNHIPESYRRKLHMTDFSDVNSVNGKNNCYLCTLAGASDMIIGQLAKKHPNDVLKWQDTLKTDPGEDANGIKDLFKHTEFPDTKYYRFSNPDDMIQHLTTIMKIKPPGAVFKFGYGFTYPPPHSFKHVVMGRAWLDQGKLQTLYTDFQTKPDDYFRRFSTDPFFKSSPDHFLFDLGSKVPRPVTEVDKLADLVDSLKFGAARDIVANNMGKDISQHITKLDLVPIKNTPSTGATSAGSRCPWCVAAMYGGVQEKGLAQDGFSIELSNLKEAAKVEHLISVYRQIGYPDTSFKFSCDDEKSLRDHLEVKLADDEYGTYKNLVLAYEPNDEASSGVNSVVLHAKKGPKGVELLMTDYNYEPDDPKRFKKSISELDGNGARKIYLVDPRNMAERKQPSLLDRDKEVDFGTSGSGINCTQKLIIGYVAAWSRVELTIQRASRFNHLIYAFANMHHDGSLTLPSESAAKQRLLEMLTARDVFENNYARLRLSVAIGGWANSEHFSRVLSDERSRAKLIEDITGLLQVFDGVDIDWEYPGTGGATNGFTADRENYVEFLKKLREKLPKGKLISIAGAAGEEALHGFDIKKISELVDWIGVMTYDFNGAWDSKWGAYVGPVAALDHASPPGYSGKLNVHWALKQWVCQSGDASKIVMGLPFYGRYWTKTKPGKDPQAYPLFRMAELVGGKYGGEMSYRAIERDWFYRTKATRLWDALSSTPWSMDETTGSVLAYDDAKSLAYKVEYARRHDLGGVMVWSVDQDDYNLTLTSTIGKVCLGSTNTGISYKCNPLGEERRWWQWTENVTNAGMCGRNAPLYNGFYPHCDPDDPGFACCSKFGYCGSSPEHCDCPECVNYGDKPDLLTQEPTKPSRPIQWHVGFSEVKPGEPRCGSMAPPVGDHLAICNPDDNHNHCCSPYGHCGAGSSYCDCPGCKNYRKLSLSESLVRVRRPEEIKWHIGFAVVEPGKPRCGSSAPKIRGQEAICNPDDDLLHCCSPAGYCGNGSQYCECKGCIDSRKQSGSAFLNLFPGFAPLLDLDDKLKLPFLLEQSSLAPTIQLNVRRTTASL